MDKINYSIIIPHKNTSNLLKHCLDSIPLREDIQIIIVDDNSDPKKANFDTFPGLGIPHIEIVFTKEGKGAGYARNVGLKKAVGKWVLFADADDFFADNFAEYLDKYKNSTYDLIYFGIYRVNKNTEKNNIDPKYDKLMMDAIYKQQYDAYKYTAYVPWGKMIKLSLIKENNISFDETMVANDKFFSVKTAYYAKNIHFDEHRIYTYVPGHGFLTHVKTTEANFERFCVYVRMNRFFESISQKKYKINLISPLKNLVDIWNMKYFFSGIKIMTNNNYNIFVELFNFCLFLLLNKKQPKYIEKSKFILNK